MEFDESSVKVDPDVFYSHKGIVYRLAGETEVTDVSFTSDAVVVFQRPNYKDYPTSVRVYSRKGIDRDYYPPKSVVIGKPLTVLSGLCSGKLTAVNELIDSSPYGDGDDKIAYHMLNGFRGHDGRIEDTFPNIYYALILLTKHISEFLTCLLMFEMIKLVIWIG